MLPEMLLLLSGLIVVLSFASAVSACLIARAGPQPGQSMVNFEQRINAWWAMVALIAGAFLLGDGGIILLFALVSFAAMREFFTLTHSRRSDHRVLVSMFFFVLPVQYALVWSQWYGLYTIFIPVYCFLLMPAFAALRGDTENFLERIAEHQWGIMLAIYCLSHVPALLTLDIPGFEGRNALLIAFLIVTVQGSDVLQYVFGRLFGRHRLAPLVSPSKTLEGLLGGVASASLLGGLLFWLTPFSPLQAAVIALVACLMGFLGGLVASAIKRDRGIKDWGQMIEGHGGMLDRADSLVFAAPVFFHLVRYFWAA